MKEQKHYSNKYYKLCSSILLCTAKLKNHLPAVTGLTLWVFMGLASRGRLCKREAEKTSYHAVTSQLIVQVLTCQELHKNYITTSLKQ